MFSGISVAALHQVFLLLRDESVHVDYGELLCDRKSSAWHSLVSRMRELGLWRKLRIVHETCGIPLDCEIFIHPVQLVLNSIFSRFSNLLEFHSEVFAADCD